MKYFLFIALTLSYSITQSQDINAYARVTSVTGSNILALSNVDQTNHNFNTGEQIIIMQMQDDVIGANTTNAATFGNLSAIANAGRYEVATISARTPATGAPTSLTLSAALANTYNTGANSRVQIITFRNLGANYTTTANLTCINWDGNIGGVLAFQVANVLTLNHRVLAENRGFRGGTVSNDNGGPVCDPANSTNYRANNANLGWKGEGIYLSTSTTYNNARGKILNGGGGGGDHNAGGGGGGNYTAGGIGGAGYNNCTTNPGGGLGGIALSAQISGSRVFMGGGGGGGQQNNSVASAGGRGGGIILIKANQIETSTTCGSSIRISANGQNANDSGGNDAAGGGGAGGSIVINANSYNINAACPLTVRANGGDGGDCTDGTPHAGGGGGGQGVVIYSSARPTTNVTTQTSNGAAGADNSGGSITAGSGGGTNGTGIIDATPTPLPVELIEFKANKYNKTTQLSWKTASEKNNKSFIIEKSTNGVEFQEIGRIMTNMPNSTSIKTYQFIDFYPTEGINYYRLKQSDLDDTFEYSAIIFVDFETQLSFSIIPNPLQTKQSLSIKFESSDLNVADIFISDLTGKHLIEKRNCYISKGTLSIENIILDAGVYIVSAEIGAKKEFKRLVIE